MDLKRFFALSLFLLSIIATGYSAPENITQCPTTTQNDTEYILQPTFTFNAVPCFDLTNTQNVVIDGNNIDFFGANDLRIDSNGGSSNAVIKNLKHDSIQIRLSSTGNDITLQDSYLKPTPFLYTGIASGIPNTNTGSGIFFISSSGSAGSISNKLVVQRNRFESSTMFQAQADTNNLFYITNHVYGYDVILKENDFVGFGLTGRKLDNGGGHGGFTMDMHYARFLVYDNVYLDANPFMTYNVIDNAFDCSNFQISNDNLFSSEALTDTTDQNGISDEVLNIQSNGCILINDNVRTTKQFKNPQFAKSTQTEYATMTPLFFGSQLFSNARYYLGKELTLDSGVQWSFTGTHGSVLDLSLFPNRVAINLENTRTILMGTNNKIEGITTAGKQPIIKSQGTISIADEGIYGNNWHLIEYDNGLTIEGINFQLNAIDNYGLLRKRNSGVDGLNFYMKDSVFDLNFVPASPDRPFMVVGAFSKLENNKFYLLSTQNVSLLAGGTSANVGGGHKITDNLFQGGGFIFSKLTDAFGGTNYPSSFIHNEFRQSGSLYAYPFHPTNNALNTLDDPQLNGTYFYKTACTNYEFNIGNYYEDWADSGFYNDSNGDGIHDEYNGINYIERGQDYQGDPIRDFRSVTPYPYNFAGQTGNAKATYDTCQSFNFNIIEPQSQNYTSGTDITSNWEFISIAYPNMICFEELNGFTTIYENVASGDNKGLTYDNTDGKGFFKVKCCDKPECDNIVHESPIIEFNVGDGSIGDLVVSGVTQSIEGCTDNTATNYNPSATQDDGSCTYDNGNGGNGSGGVGSGGVGSGSSNQGINVGTFQLSGIFSGDVDESQENVLGLFRLLETPMGYAILLGFLLVGFGLIALIFSFVAGIIGGKR